ncbi:SpoIIE family protein phosphatase [Streptomyces beihaiensis]|uniref:SpoIIE family protein phosphatase n=1 Tax=Streptomyces beihaiensis TaxID=2984495 RepID=A0ABT3U0R1_9ACTN|nr:SpoIIE family protein phosphatase [Streptomyces beihaiensis]MCX3062891.1 SpoIIE family protein phosphatase [Streptomyces beihaiensis]
MRGSEPFSASGGARTSTPPGGLLDLLSVCAVVVDSTGRIVLWSPQAEDVFGYTAQEALGEYAAPLLLHRRHQEAAARLFSEVMSTGTGWAGAFPIRHKDGRTRLVEFRNMRLLDDRGDVYALGIAADQPTLQRVETGLALSQQLITQSPIGLALLDQDLRYLLVNPALERINGLSAAEHIGHHPRDILTFLGDVDAIEATLREVLTTGVPVIDRNVVGRTPADPDHDHAWSVSYYRLEGAQGQVMGVANSVVDITPRHLARTEAERGRRRLDLIARASATVGTTLDVERTAQELADAVVPVLADVAAVDILDSALELRSGDEGDGPRRFRAMGLATAYPTEAADAVDPIGHLASYHADRLITRCVRTAAPVLVPEVTDSDLPRVARDEDAAKRLATAGVHSYLAVPLTARDEVLGTLALARARTQAAFDQDDVLLARELAARAAIAIDNARWHQSVRSSAETLQRSLLPNPPPPLHGLDVCSRYQPAQASSAVGGDWYDVIPLDGERTALVVGDVMGHGIDAAAAMGRLRTATLAYSDLAMAPDEVLHHLDKTTAKLEPHIATCVYAVYDPHHHTLRISNAGHMPPVLIPHGHPPRLLNLPTGAPLGVGGVEYRTTDLALNPHDRLVLYTDGLVETRNHPIDDRLDLLLRLLTEHSHPTEATCTHLLETLRDGDTFDDIALLIAQAR